MNLKPQTSTIAKKWPHCAPRKATMPDRVIRQRVVRDAVLALIRPERNKRDLVGLPRLPVPVAKGQECRPLRRGIASMLSTYKAMWRREPSLDALCHHCWLKGAKTVKSTRIWGGLGVCTVCRNKQLSPAEMREAEALVILTSLVYRITKDYSQVELLLCKPAWMRWRTWVWQHCETRGWGKPTGGGRPSERWRV